MSAAGEFLIDSKIEYKVSETGKTTVTHNINLENATTEYYATSYGLTLENIDAQNVRSYTVNGAQLTVNSEKQADKTNINITFPDAVVGKGKSRNFTVSYDNSSFTAKTGEVWEITIPKLFDEESYRNYEITLSVPYSFGQEAYISPSPKNRINESGFIIYEFNKEDLIKTGVTAAFGEFQVFSFTLNYHLENPLSKVAQTEIAIPPDTAFQKVYIRSLNPEPKNVVIDEDGNWLAIYELEPRQRLDVTASGEVQIFSGSRHFPKPTREILDANLLATSYWQADDPEIKNLALKLKTPQAIYDFVSSTLKYDYERVRPNVERLGAINALKNPSSAICMEFTDLFIALSRAAGIPAREVNGYAYTENPEIQPLSLVSDVLHAWPEYWNEEKGAWIPVDPTWGSTTGGEDFFSKLDLRHFTFVNHGKSATLPYPPGSYKLGANPQKDVFVYFGKLSPEKTLTPNISAELKNEGLLINAIIDIKVKNPNTQALYNLELNTYFDDQEYFKKIIEILPPYGSYQENLSVPYSILGKDTPDKITVKVEGEKVEVITNKNQVIIFSLLIIFIIFITFLIVILIKLKWTKKLSEKFQKVREFIYLRIKGNQSI